MDRRNGRSVGAAVFTWYGGIGLVDAHLRELAHDLKPEDRGRTERQAFDAAHPALTLDSPLFFFGSELNGGAVESDPDFFQQNDLPPAADMDGFSHLRQMEPDFDEGSDCADITKIHPTTEGVRLVTNQPEDTFSQHVSFKGLVEVCLTDRADDPEDRDIPDDSLIAVIVQPQSSENQRG